jgi:hypothetical protein
MILKLFSNSITGDCIHLQVCLAPFQIVKMLLVMLIHKPGMNYCTNSEAFSEDGSVTWKLSGLLYANLIFLIVTLALIFRIYAIFSLTT